jgi:hypothetical protein
MSHLRLNVGRVTDVSKLAAGLAVIVLLTPEISAYVIPHFYHPRYIPPLAHPAAGVSGK